MIRRNTLGLVNRLAVVLSLALLSSLLSLPSLADGTGKWTSGEETYKKVCAYCHEAGVGPYLLGRQFPAVVIQFMARNGSRAMPAMKPGFIDDVALKDVAEYIEKSKPGPNAPKSTLTEYKENQSIVVAAPVVTTTETPVIAGAEVVQITAAQIDVQQEE